MKKQNQQAPKPNKRSTRQTQLSMTPQRPNTQLLIEVDPAHHLDRN